MSITINPSSTDDPSFVALVERIVARLDEYNEPDEVFIIEIKNWFDHKWLKFSGIGRVPFDHFASDHSQTALDEFFQDKITFPPFTPNRILNQWLWTYGASKRRHPVHRKNQRQHSSWNLHKRVSQFAKSALFVWFSSGTQSNDRASLMVYKLDGKVVDAWYASLRKAAGWKLDRTKCIERSAVEGLMGTVTQQLDKP
jgi:hypothetical protein